MNNGENPKRRQPLLRRAEQACAGCVLFISLLAIAISIFIQHHRGSGLIDLEDPHERDEIEFQVDLNTAEAAELRLLPGVGEKIAQRIIDSRTKDGRFQSVDDLQRVRGIGPKTLERIKPYLLPIAPAEDVADR